jgi:hypothetical protein
MIGERGDRELEICAQLRDALWGLDGVKDIGDVMRPLGALSGTTEHDDG